MRDERFPAERLLQAIWRHQRLRRDRLQTADGRVVRVFHPGFSSAEGGPDFRAAVLQIGADPPQSGDVEIDLQTSGWRAHGHDRNSRFKNVLLQVVWDHAASSAPPADGLPPVLALKNFLDSSLEQLSRSLEEDPPSVLPEPWRGKCRAPLAQLDLPRREQLLGAAAWVRFENKAALFRIRAKDAGWEQALWEGLFRALGYKHNAWPMQALAEIKPRWSPPAGSAFVFQARLLGLSGLLPAELPSSKTGGQPHLRRLWDFWWRERDQFATLSLPRPAWKLYGLRPANHPQRRLALASHWLADRDFVSKIEAWADPRFAENLSHSLHTLLQPAADDFWSWHWTFRSARLPAPQPLLGAARVTDLAVNVILPWLWIRAVEGKNEPLQREIERRYKSWSAAEDNAILKLARQRLLGLSNPRATKTAAAQQGLMQIVRDFCSHSNALCENCLFPELAAEFGTF
ncbi:MAG: DUF2851 family protein [Verrucomicrobia bacterium]|nr:DUF2851 family protein [Verrucomicrobiota bacterium]MDE3098982.1 DUF2851 family protein [Verrucomicrobiota bacterium]